MEWKFFQWKNRFSNKAGLPQVVIAIYWILCLVLDLQTRYSKNRLLCDATIEGWTESQYLQRETSRDAKGCLNTSVLTTILNKHALSPNFCSSKRKVRSSIFTLFYNRSQFGFVLLLSYAFSCFISTDTVVGQSPTRTLHTLYWHWDWMSTKWKECSYKNILKNRLSICSKVGSTAGR